MKKNNIPIIIIINPVREAVKIMEKNTIEAKKELDILIPIFFPFIENRINIGRDWAAILAAILGSIKP